MRVYDLASKVKLESARGAIRLPLFEGDSAFLPFIHQWEVLEDMTSQNEDARNQWNTAAYDEGHSFVFEYGEGVVELLDPQPGERVLDLGCGTGHLTHQIAEAGAAVVGLDASTEMIAKARESYPDLQFVQADARDFSLKDFPLEEPFDAVFSNAALHWIPEQDAVLDSVTDVLTPDGRFVAELGGEGNVAVIVDAAQAAAATRGYEVENPWYFPSVAEYATKLDAHGLEVRYAILFDRPTKLDGGEDGLASWLSMFGDGLLSAIPKSDRRAVVSDVEARLRDELFEDGQWTADYRRLRVVAHRQ